MSRMPRDLHAVHDEIWTLGETADHLRIPRRNQPRKDAPSHPTTDAARKRKAVMPLIHSGEIDGLRINGEWRVSKASVLAFAGRQLAAAKACLHSTHSGGNPNVYDEPAPTIMASDSAPRNTPHSGKKGGHSDGSND